MTRVGERRRSASSERTSDLPSKKPAGRGPDLAKRPVDPPASIDRAKIEKAVRLILEAIGEDPDREGLSNTPARVARMYEEVFGGLVGRTHPRLGTYFSEKHDEIVVVKDISFHSMCEHHLLPFFGRAHVAYLPDGRILGISKLARVVEAFARRPQVQERLTGEVADTIDKLVTPAGVAVVMEATHTCMTIRGVKKPGSLVITSAMRGTFKTDAASRSEVMSLITRSSGGFT